MTNKSKKKKSRKKSNAIAKDLRSSDGKYRMRVEKPQKGAGSYDRKNDDSQSVKEDYHD